MGINQHEAFAKGTTHDASLDESLLTSLGAVRCTRAQVAALFTGLIRAWGGPAGSGYVTEVPGGSSFARMLLLTMRRPGSSATRPRRQSAPVLDSKLAPRPWLDHTGLKGR